MDDNVHDLSERFLAVLAGDRTPKNIIDDDEFGAMLMRMIRAWERRVVGNPEMLAQNMAMVQRFAEITNVVIAANAMRYAVDPRRGASMTECARILGISKPSASERRARGVEIMNRRVVAAAAARFSEAKREREALAAAHDHAVVQLADYRARHQAAG